MTQKIDKVFVINLEHRGDRRVQIKKELARMNIENYEIFPAIKPTVEMIQSWNPKFLDPMPQWFVSRNGDHTKYRIGSLGCMMSHMKIMELCIERNYENVLILEDDTLFQDHHTKGRSWEELWTSIVQELNVLPTYGLVYLAGNHRGSQCKTVTKQLMKVNGTLTTGSYIVSKDAMKYIVQHIYHYPREIDVFYANIIQSKFACYCVVPHWTKQGNGYSDIVQEHVSYNLG